MTKAGIWEKRMIVMTWVCRLALAAAFIYAGILKNADPKSFASSIAGFELLPEAWINVIVLSLPWLEIFSGLLLLAGRYARLGALSIAFLNGVFLLALLSALIRGIPVDCGCFGSSGPSTPFKILFVIGRDFVFLLMAVFVYTSSNRSGSCR